MTAADDRLTAEIPWPPAAVALDLARQMVAEWRAIGAAATRARNSDDPTATLRMEIAGYGKQQMEAARLAAWFAQVSIAEDLRAIRLLLLPDGTAADDPDSPLRRWARGEPVIIPPDDEAGEPDTYREPGQ